MRFWPRSEHRAAAPAETDYTTLALDALLRQARGVGAADVRGTALFQSPARGSSLAPSVAPGSRGQPYATAAVSPALLASIGRAVVEGGEWLGLLEVTPRPMLRTVKLAAVTGAARSIRRRVTLPGPDRDVELSPPDDALAVVIWHAHASQPWRGVSPFDAAGVSAKLAAVLERASLEEADGPIATILSSPHGDAEGQELLETFRRELAGARGGLVMLPSLTNAGAWGTAASGSPPAFVEALPRRIAPSWSDVLPQLRGDVAASLATACGIPPSLLSASPSPAVLREAQRELLAGTVEPLARLVEGELSRVLDADVRLTFERTRSADVTGRARAAASLVGAGATLQDALRMAGLDD